jgi:hypothetical protein
MTYTWEILWLDTKDVVDPNGVTLSKAVLEVQFKRVGTDDDSNRFAIGGVAALNTDALESSSFIAFESLTEEQVLNWVTAEIGQNNVDDFDARILAKKERYGKVMTEVPWS